MSYVEKFIRCWRKHSFFGNMFSQNAFAKFLAEFKHAVREQAESAGFTVAEFIEDESSCVAILESVHGDAYVSTGNIRCLDKSWMDRIMYRTLFDRTNLRGGSNHYTTLRDLAVDLKKLY